MTTDKQEAVTLVGLGAMGSALARAFLQAGRPTTVWNRTRSKADELATEGATTAATLHDAVDASQLVVLCVVTNDVVHDLFDQVGDRLAGKTVVNLTNGSPNQARDLAVRATNHGADYLDGGIMAIPPMIATPEAFVLYSGPRDAFDRAEPALASLGTTRYVGEDTGLAALYDLALLSGMYGTFIGVLQAIALVRSEGVHATGFLELLQPWLAAMSATVPAFATAADTGDHRSDVASPLGMQAAAFGNLVEASRDQGVSADLFMPLQALMDKGVAAGYGDANLSALVELLRAEPSRSVH